jgi:hypothetical protein
VGSILKCAFLINRSVTNTFQFMKGAQLRNAAHTTVVSGRLEHLLGPVRYSPTDIQQTTSALGGAGTLIT